MIAVADAAQYGDPPPREVQTVYRIKRWGDPWGGGWKDWPAGMLQRLTVAENITEAFKSAKRARPGKFKEWTETNPDQAEIFDSITGLRMKMAEKDGS